VESTPDQDSERRERSERRSLIDLTRAERGEPERRHLPGVERRDDVADVPEAERLPADGEERRGDERRGDERRGDERRGDERRGSAPGDDA